MQRNARLALPEVVRLEVERNFRRELKMFVNIVRDNYRMMYFLLPRIVPSMMRENTNEVLPQT
jgi:hypothetical protein